MNIPTRRQLSMWNSVVRQGNSIDWTVQAYGVSESTVRRAIDAVTEFSFQKISMELAGHEWLEVMGWLRNGNVTSGELADKIENHIWEAA